MDYYRQVLVHRYDVPVLLVLYLDPRLTSSSNNNNIITSSNNINNSSSNNSDNLNAVPLIFKNKMLPVPQRVYLLLLIPYPYLFHPFLVFLRVVVVVMVVVVLVVP